MKNYLIINDAGVDEDLLRKIIDQAEQINGKILLRLMEGAIPFSSTRLIRLDLAPVGCLA